ncbi:PAS-domain containing protein [Tropicibacter sp. S64]|uniref:PAS-domain containing protein n=1 Tax=Tropicibacter sp. S64 TaxID=3415122 RepID=UPI003C7CBD90
MNDFLALTIGILTGVALFLLGWMAFGILIRRLSSPARSTLTPVSVFLFDGSGRLMDTTPDVRDVVHAPLNDGFTWADLYRIFRPRFPDLPKDLPDREIVLVSEDLAATEMLIAPEGSLVRVTLRSDPVSPAMQHQYIVQSEELEMLTSAFNVAPNPIWATDPDGTVIWNNAAFDKLNLVARQDQGAEPLISVTHSVDTWQESRRTQIEQIDGSTRWFEVTSRRTHDHVLHFATDIDTLIEAELAQRNFVQTLAKTFAHLPIGLAVFDRERRLVLFNPALVDLTRLPMDFLSARPNMLSFFDLMRENRMMPEPKNYASWREQLTDVVAAARDDRYCETWSLASGLTYKITGRPHPDGAIAFLLEDISAEISLTRRFRSELELTQSVIDCFPEAVAVFSRLGVLTFCNTAYRQLWDCDPDSSFNETTITDATDTWQKGCKESDIWPGLRDYVTTMQDRSPWSRDLRLRDGRDMRFSVEPVSAGATMVRFSLAPPRRTRSIGGSAQSRAVNG